MQFWQTGDVITASGLNGNITTVIASTTLSSYHTYILCNASANSFTITLPISGGNGKIYEIKRIDEMGNNVSIFSSCSIDGVFSSIDLFQDECYTFIHENEKYYII